MRLFKILPFGLANIAESLLQVTVPSAIHLLSSVSSSWYSTVGAFLGRAKVLSHNLSKIPVIVTPFVTNSNRKSQMRSMIQRNTRPWLVFHATLLSCYRHVLACFITDQSNYLRIITSFFNRQHHLC